MDDEPIMNDKDVNPEEVIEDKVTADLKSSASYKTWIARAISLS